MNVLLIAPLRRKVAPEITASRPRFVFDLATQLIDLGHTVSILGTGDSNVPGATIIPVIPKSLNQLPPFENQFYAESGLVTKQAMMVKDLAPNFDVIHNHCFPEFFALLIADQIKTPMVTTLHPPATAELDDVLSLFPQTYLVSPSEAQKKALKKTHISMVIPHGTDTDLYAFSERGGEYLLWIGRLGFAKGADNTFIDGKGVRIAIAAAKKATVPLKLTANVENTAFFEADVAPHLNTSIEWIGEVSTEQPLSKETIAKLLQNAKAVLITTRFDEAFGLTAIESMSCGTPVIGMDKGGLPELITDGVTGFIVPSPQNPWEDSEALVADVAGAIEKLYQLPEADYLAMRAACRKKVESAYSLEKMAENYVVCYEDCSKRAKASAEK